MRRDNNTVNDAAAQWAVNYQPVSRHENSSTPAQVGEALKAIQDERLYRDEFSDFYVYCARKWGMRPEVVDRYIALSERQEQPSESPKEKETVAGTIYFLSDSSMVKIGHTANLDARVKSIQNMSPVPLSLLGTIPGSVQDEQKLHGRFAHLRQHGEWFSMTDELSAFIRGQSR